MVYNDGGALNVATSQGRPPGWDYGDDWNREHTWRKREASTRPASPMAQTCIICSCF